MKITGFRATFGFTLIELIIVIAMTMLVATALIMNFRSGETQKRVNLSRDMVITALRTAQNMSLTGKQIPPSPQVTHVRGPSRHATNDAAVAFWVEFPSTGRDFYIMAQDTNGAVLRMQTYTLPQRTMLASSSPYAVNTGAGSSNYANLAVKFLQPFGAMTAATANGPLPADFSAFTTATVSISSEDGSRTTTVTADGISGKIE